MNKVSVVILNYLNYLDTIECVESIFEMNYELEGIVIVDNHSNNESYKILSKKYKNNNRIIVIRTGQNYGFAKGNNIGMAIARQRFHTDFVLVVNNDTIFEQKDFFEKLLNHYEHGVGMIGSAIHLKGDATQKEFLYDLSFIEMLKIILELYLIQCGKVIWLFMVPAPKKRNEKKIIQGCAILFTPDFFKHYSGFYKKTFLYAEEPILYFMCKKYSLRQIYVHDTFIYHKVNQSSEMSFHNDVNVKNNYRRQSYGYLVWWIIKDKVNETVKKLLQNQNIKEIYESTADLKNYGLESEKK